MKKSILIGLILSSVSATAAAQQLSDRNLVERSLTLKDSEVLLAGGIGYGETGSENETGIALNAAYGVTDNFTIGLGGLRYRIIEKANPSHGLEVAIGAGLKGAMERQNEDVYGYGADVLAKYVVSSNLAFLFGTEYVKWDHDNNSRYDGSEMRYSVGALYQPIRHLTWSIDYTYRDLNDFVQSSAYAVSTGVHYSLSKSTDVGVTFEYTDFDAEQNGFDVDSAYRRNLGAYVSYRF